MNSVGARTVMFDFVHWCDLSEPRFLMHRWDNSFLAYLAGVRKEQVILHSWGNALRNKDVDKCANNNNSNSNVTLSKLSRTKNK